MEENKTINKKQRIYLIVGIVLLLILILSASYAYFAITSVNNGTSTTVTGTGEELGSPTLTTNTTSLGLDLTAEMMSQDTVGYYYYASPDKKLISSTYDDLSMHPEMPVGNGKYELATVTLDKGINLDCTFTYDITATTTKELTDYSEVYIIITDAEGKKTTYALESAVEGITYTGKIYNLAAGTPQKIYVESYVENSSSAQESLVGNTYTINITPKSGTNGFKCDASFSRQFNNKAASQVLVDNASNFSQLWKSDYEGDGYRFIGNAGLVTHGKNSGENLYNDSANPSNFICFGTTNKSDCTSNPNKYMYRIIGIFQEENGDGTVNTNSPWHLKLMKFTSIGNYQYHSDSSAINITWQDTDLSKGLNGSYFLDNINYDYMQNNTWKNKIADWKWSTVVTASDISYSSGNIEQFKLKYLHELNRSTKTTTTGSWYYPTQKIGLIYTSDLNLSNGAAAMSLRYRWLHHKNNILNEDYRFTSSWFISARIANSKLNAYRMEGANTYLSAESTKEQGVRPAFYLNSDVEFTGGSGSFKNPYMIKL